MPVKIAPSILSANFGAFADAARALSDAGADYLHIDVMDGQFVPNLTFGPPLVRDLRPITTVPFDCHLMIVRPEQFAAEFAELGSELVTIHAEATPHLQRVLTQITEAGASAGVAVNPATPLENIAWILDDVKRVLIMTVNPGFGGQKFLTAMPEKVRQLAKMRETRGLNFEIGVDGGVSKDTVKSVVDAGADVLIAGSAVFNHPDGLAAAIAELREAAAR